MQSVVFSKKGQILLSFTSLNFICFQWIQFKFCVHLKVLETTNTNINIRELLPNTKWANKWLQTRSRYSYHALKSNSGKIFFGFIHIQDTQYKTLWEAIPGEEIERNQELKKCPSDLQIHQLRGTHFTCQVPAPKGWKNPDLFILSI